GVCYNCTSCSGVRDVGDFSLEGTRTIASPATVGADDGINCDRFACPYTSGITPYRGPMGYEGHCESLIASTANWDLKNALVGEFGESGWQRMDQIWYGSLVPSKSAYRVASGGQCNPSANVDGCGSNNWYTVYLAVDDDNGNLADGTPNGCRVWDAFNAPGTAPGGRPAPSPVRRGSRSRSNLSPPPFVPATMPPTTSTSGRSMVMTARWHWAWRTCPPAPPPRSAPIRCRRAGTAGWSCRAPH